jgi:hypothetical protein
VNDTDVGGFIRDVYVILSFVRMTQGGRGVLDRNCEHVKKQWFACHVGKEAGPRSKVRLKLPQKANKRDTVAGDLNSAFTCLLPERNVVCRLQKGIRYIRPAFS